MKVGFEPETSKKEAQVNVFAEILVLFLTTLNLIFTNYWMKDKKARIVW